MGLVFKLNKGSFDVYFRRISTGDTLAAGLDELRLAETAQEVAKLNKNSEINGSWYQSATVSRILQFKT